MTEDRYITNDWFDTFPLGNEDPGIKHWLDDTEKSFGCNNGFSESDVTYIINEFRYRGDITPAVGVDAAFGCSYTLGQGSPVSWPELLGIVNCGMNGASNDRIVRAAIAYCKQYKPSNIYVMWTFVQRREYITEDGSPVRFRMPPRDKIHSILCEPSADGAHLLLMNDKADEYNLQKNKLLLESFCTANNIKLHQMSVNSISKNSYTLARDGDHPGPEWHDRIATHFLL